MVLRGNVRASRLFPMGNSEHPRPKKGEQSAASVDDVVNEWLRLNKGDGKGGGDKHKAIPHPSLEERERTGRVARAVTPREEMRVWIAPADRRDPVSILKKQDQSRVQALVPVRHARMAVSPFTFYRGSAAIMAADLAATPLSGLTVQLCGDAHLSNFGLFASPDRRVIFDVNDFDETHPGPFEWDVKRLAASFVLAARDNGMTDVEGRAAAAMAAASYRESMVDYAGKPELDIWYDRVDSTFINSAIEGMTAKKQIAGKKGKVAAERAVQQAISKARTRDAWSAISKITEVVDGHRRFQNMPPLLTRLEMNDEAWSVISGLFRDYRSTLQEDRQELLKRYELVDMGHKVVGVGSVGLLAFVLLLRGRDENDLIVLQVKQAQSSVLEAYTHKSQFSKHGHRVVAGQRLMQAASDSFLGWIEGPGGRNYYVRQLRDMKWSPDPSTLVGERLGRYAVLCGHTLARAHARSGDAVAIAAYLGKGRAFDSAIAEFGITYAEQVAEDYAAFTSAIADGRMEANEAAADIETSPVTSTLSSM